MKEQRDMSRCSFFIPHHKELKRMLTARQLRNRVLMILDRDDNMREAEMIEEETGQHQPAILFRHGTQTYMIVFVEVK